ncbi:MAG: hypothetical protein HYV97_18745 [Bdellovibrio sp.]|nr:hypothetical protein [Bdellovibrio sp.]
MEKMIPTIARGITNNFFGSSQTSTDATMLNPSIIAASFILLLNIAE